MDALPSTPRVLLLDIGGVVLRSPIELVEALAAREPRLRPAVDAIGGVASAHDELWQEMLRGEVSEREYWARRAVGLGTSIGEAWDTRTFIDRLYDAPEDVWLRPEAVGLMKEVRAAGLGLGALTNDLSAFHGPDWVDAQWWLHEFDHVVDASVNGILKPDPRAYALGCEAFDAHARRGRVRRRHACEHRGCRGRGAGGRTAPLRRPDRSLRRSPSPARPDLTIEETPCRWFASTSWKAARRR